MKTDRELLELAAKAAGIDGWWEAPYLSFILRSGGVWRPLTDDGDALRLAVKLGVTFHSFPDHHQGAQVVATPPTLREVREHAENHGYDLCAATRRAITRAAAAIGESLP
jgi:hypothetical protein